MPHLKPRIAVIAALAKNRVIGVHNTLPWRLPEDLQHFKALTLGHHIVMGRKTFESIGRPLPGRTTVIISRNDYSAPAGCLVAHSIADALAACAGDQEVFFVGGAQLYEQVLPLAERLYLTEIHAEFAGDAWFPQFARAAWAEFSRDPRHDAASALDYDFVVYQRKEESI
ncbi:MAG TPA: dihydrofolate reductase [Sulfuriferula sp.]|nr:dihydrofolate reductase [Sulfuriferula sp.]